MAHRKLLIPPTPRPPPGPDTLGGAARTRARAPPRPDSGTSRLRIQGQHEERKIDLSQTNSSPLPRENSQTFASWGLTFRCEAKAPAHKSSSGPSRCGHQDSSLPSSMTSLAGATWTKNTLALIWQRPESTVGEPNLL